MRTRLLALLGLLLASPLSAATLNDIDLTSQSITRTSVTSLGGNLYEMVGVSNGVGYTYTGGAYLPSTGTTTFNDFPSSNLSHRDIHAGSVFTIVFDSPITSLLVAMRNDNNPGLMGVDFGVVASDTTDTVTTGTTDYRVTDLFGSLTLFEFAAPTTSVTQQIPSTGDGFDLAFFADPVPASVPLPAAGVLAFAGLGALVALGRQRKPTAG